MAEENGNKGSQAQAGGWRGMVRSMLREVLYDTLIFPIQQRIWRGNQKEPGEGGSSQGTPISKNQEDEAVLADVFSLLEVAGARGIDASDHLKLLLEAFQAMGAGFAERFRRLIIADYKPGDARQAMDQLFDSIPDGDGDSIWQSLTNPPTKVALVRRAIHYARMVEKNIDPNTSARDAALKAAQEILTRGDIRETAAERMTREGKHLLTGFSAPKISRKGWLIFGGLIALCFVLFSCSPWLGSKSNTKDISACDKAQACKDPHNKDPGCKAILERWSNACGLENPAEKALAPGIKWLQSLSPSTDKSNVKLQSTRKSLKAPGRVLLSWEASGADQCSWKSGDVVDTSGSESVFVTETTTFSLTCEINGRKESASVVVEVLTETAR